MNEIVQGAAQSSPIPRAESIPEFRMAQLLLVLAGASTQKKRLDLERLSVIEFLAANPFLVLPLDSSVSKQLRLQGFGRHSIDYASPGQRYVSRRERIASDVAQLVAYGLVRLSVSGGQRVLTITPSGEHAAEALCSVYSDAYRLSTQAVLPIVMKLSPTKMRASFEQWFRVDPILFDLLDAPSMDEFGAEASNLKTQYKLF